MSIKLKPLREQVIVLVGASSGIGLATALAAAKEGAKLVLAARTRDALEATVRRITAGTLHQPGAAGQVKGSGPRRDGRDSVTP